jgi:hypothetical protein
MKDWTEGKLQETLDFAKSINDESLQKCIDRLKLVENNIGCETNVSNDFAPKSFYFERLKDGKFCGNGGIIWHGKHDNGGDGGAPTFSVCLEPICGWSIHT